MELRVLRYYLTVVQEQNMSRAAEVLHLTQPTLSRQIAQLERELGAQLFERGRKLELTPAGVRLKDRAEELVRLADLVEDEFHTAGVEGVVRIGSGGLSSSKVLPAAMEGFRNQNPHVSFEMYTNSADYVVGQLEKGLLDFGFLLEPVDTERFDYVRLDVRERWGLLVRRGDALAARASVDANDLLGRPLVVTARPDLQRELGSWLGIDFGQLDVLCTYNVVTNVMMLVDSGVASALTIAGAVELYDPARFAFLPLEPELSSPSVLAWKRSSLRFGAPDHFLSYLRGMLPQNGVAPGE